MSDSTSSTITQSMLDYSNKKCLFDVTIFDGHKQYLTFNEVIEAASKVFNKFVFQKEECPSTKKPHWQFRGSLIKRASCGVVKGKLIPAFPGNWSLTSSTVHNDARVFNYVMKEDTRIEGPWSDKDIPPEPKPMTPQLKLFLEGGYHQGEQLLPVRLPWHDQIIQLTSQFDMRSIYLIYDTIGNSQKSIYLEYLEYMDLAFEAPPFRGMEDMMQFCYSFPAQKMYFIDMPRGMKKDKLADFYAGIETLKNGVLYDKRYEGKKKRIARPHIVVYTNTLPVLSLMSTDRWKIYTMQADKSIKELSVDDLIKTQSGHTTNPEADAEDALADFQL